VMARWQRPNTRHSMPSGIDAGPAPSASPATIAFVPQAAELTIRFDSVQASGTVTLLADSGRQVSASITGGAADEGFVVLPDGLRIRNSGASVATYRVSVPTSIGRVRVHVGIGPMSRTVVVGLEPGRSYSLSLRE